MKAIPMSHDRRRLCDLACELAHRYGLSLPPGLQAWEKKQRFRKEALEPTLGEKAQAEKTGITPEERRAEITRIYERCDSGEAFRNALEERGYVLARGDRRGFVVVDQFANVHSLSRYIKGHSAKEIAKKLAPLTPEQLPGVEQAKEFARARAQAVDERRREQERAKAEERRAAAQAELEKKQAARRAELAGAEQDLLTRQAAEDLALHAAQESESSGLIFRVRSAVADLVRRTPGLRSVLGPIQRKLNLDPKERHALEREALERRHAREKLDIERRKRFLAQVEQRERQSLEKSLQRKANQARRLEAEAPREHIGAARETPGRRRRYYRSGDLSRTFGDAAVTPQAEGGAGGEDTRAPTWKARAEKHAKDREHKRGKGYGYRRDDDKDFDKDP
jgi:hypothetical protein